MAGRPRKTTTEDTQTQNKENPTLDLVKENKELKAQLQELTEKINNQQGEVSNNVSKNKDMSTEDTYKDINPLKPIKIISLFDGGVSLRTNASGSGKTFRFDKFGHSLSITYSDLQDVISTDRSFIEEGVVYICDATVVKNNYLDECYSKFLTVDKITNILKFSESDIVDMVSNTTESIQETIISLLVKKIINNEHVDANKAKAIGDACKTPCDIFSLALQKKINK